MRLTEKAAINTPRTITEKTDTFTRGEGDEGKADDGGNGRKDHEIRSVAVGHNLVEIAGRYCE